MAGKHRFSTVVSTGNDEKGLIFGLIVGTISLFGLLLGLILGFVFSFGSLFGLIFGFGTIYGVICLVILMDKHYQPPFTESDQDISILPVKMR